MDFFTKDHYNSSEKVAIIGSMNEKLSYIKNGKRYIDVDNQTYEVIDILKDNGTEWNHSMLTPISSLGEKELENVEWINVSKKEFNDGILDQINNVFENAEVINNNIH
ncbi:MAG: hypothetical protein ACRDDY_01085 [Clostridium sp.]